MFTEHPVVVLIALVIVPVLGLGVALAAYLNDLGSNPESGGSGAAGGIAASSSPPPGDPTGTASAKPVTVGTCLDGQRAAAACDAPHVAEVISTGGECSTDVLLEYLGGRPGKDVLRPDVAPRTETLPDGDVCTVPTPAGADSRSARDALLGTADDVWRRCLDQVGRDVPCSEPHHDEIIIERAPPGEAVDCLARADDYLGTPFARHSDDLELLQQGEQCRLAVRSSNLLTASVRGLGTSALPLEPN